MEGKTASDIKQKRQRILDRFLNDDDKPSKGIYADPAGMIRGG